MKKYKDFGKLNCSEVDKNYLKSPKISPEFQNFAISHSAKKMGPSLLLPAQGLCMPCRRQPSTLRGFPHLCSLLKNTCLSDTQVVSGSLLWRAGKGTEAQEHRKQKLAGKHSEERRRLWVTAEGARGFTQKDHPPTHCLPAPMCSCRPSEFTCSHYS